MPELVKKLFTPFLLLLFLAESILTPLGFCGHSHANSASASETCCQESRNHCCQGVSEKTSSAPEGDQQCPSGKECHCLCALKLISIVFSRDIQIELTPQLFYSCVLQPEPPEIISTLFRPPRS